jgi:hypothetical protein
MGVLLARLSRWPGIYTTVKKWYCQMILSRSIPRAYTPSKYCSGCSPSSHPCSVPVLGPYYDWILALSEGHPVFCFVHRCGICGHKSLKLLCQMVSGSKRLPRISLEEEDKCHLLCNFMGACFHLLGPFCASAVALNFLSQITVSRISSPYCCAVDLGGCRFASSNRCEMSSSATVELFWYRMRLSSRFVH